MDTTVAASGVGDLDLAATERARRLVLHPEVGKGNDVGRVGVLLAARPSASLLEENSTDTVVSCGYTLVYKLSRCSMFDLRGPLGEGSVKDAISDNVLGLGRAGKSSGQAGGEEQDGGLSKHFGVLIKDLVLLTISVVLMRAGSWQEVV